MRGEDQRRHEGVEPGEDRELTGQPAELDSEPPVVARLMVEIRSDGSRTVARGALDDAHTGHKVAVEASGNSPLELAASLTKVIARAPRMAWPGARALRTDPSGAGERPQRAGLARRALRRVRRGLPWR